MFGECHAHMIMDGVNYREAVAQHQNKVQEEVLRRRFGQYREKGVSFIRDGGDALGVSRRAKEIAGDYGIDYRTPVFAIHKVGHYGRIVGRGFHTMKEYRALVKEAIKQGADFIKIMTTGIVDFHTYGVITGEALKKEEVKEMVKIAHQEGMAVMSHTNGSQAAIDAAEAGVDSLEHGNYLNKEAVEALADSSTVWVPTLVTVRNLIGCSRYEDSQIERIRESGAENIRYFRKSGGQAALGSDAGAHCVYHGQGICDEYQAFCTILGENRELKDWLKQGEDRIKEKFRRCR